MIYPHAIVTEASRDLLAQGIRILQGNRLAPTDEGHVSRLADYMQLNGERNVADMGCGFGEVSRLLAKSMPATDFWLVNQNEFQMEHCPEDPNMLWLYRDMCDTALPAGLMDLVMFNYSLCHVDPVAALSEAARIAHPSKGKLFVYDCERMSGDNALTEKYMAAHFLLDATFRGYCQATGWRDVETFHPGGDDTLFRKAANNDAMYDAMFDHLQPVIWRAQR